MKYPRQVDWSEKPKSCSVNCRACRNLELPLGYCSIQKELANGEWTNCDHFKKIGKDKLTIHVEESLVRLAVIISHAKQQDRRTTPFRPLRTKYNELTNVLIIDFAKNAHCALNIYSFIKTGE